MKNISIRSLFSVILAVVTAGISFGALAQGMTIPGMNFQNPIGGDLSLQMLGTMFGGVVDAIPGQSNVIGALMKIFNGAVLSLASIMGFYVTVSAVVQTAHDGEVLGKRYSSLWVPIRAVGGISMIVPAPSFSGVQMLALWLAAQGVGLANMLYVAGFDMVVKQGGFQAPTAISAPADDLVAKMVPIAACMVANAESISLAGVSDVKAVVGGRQSFDGSAAYKIVYGYKPTSGNLIECGHLKIEAPAVPSGRGDASDIAQDIAKADFEAQEEAISRAMAIVYAGVSSVSNPSNKPTNFVGQAAVAYRDYVNAKVAQAFSRAEPALNSRITQKVAQLKDGGWANFGSAFMVMADLPSQVNQQGGTSAVSVSSTPVDVIGGVTASDTISKIQRLVLETSKATPESVAGSASEGSDIVSKMWSKVREFFAPIFTFTFYDSGKAFGTYNPIIKLQAYGSLILGATVGFVGFLIVAKFIFKAGDSSVVGKVVNMTTGASAGAEGALSTLFSFLLFFLIGAIVLGLTLSVYVPMIPYIIWLSVLISWMVAVSEAVLAAPLWMMLHLNPEGDGVANGATETGYKFMAAIFLRPALSIIAGFMASFVLIAVGGFVFLTLDSVMSHSITGFASFFGWLAQCFVLAAIFMSLVAKTFSLSLTIPEQILRWIGSSLTGGTDVERDASSHFGAYVGMPVKAGGDVQSRKFSAAQQAAALNAGKESGGPSNGGLGNDEPGKTPDPAARQGVNSDVKDDRM